MAGYTGFVTKNEFENHLEDIKRGYERLNSVEEELLGNSDTGRKSLRMEFTGLIEKLTASFISEQKKTRITIIVSIILALVGLFIDRIIY